MCKSDFLRRTCWVGIFALMGLYVGACDLPTSGPSFKTKTGLNAPVVVGKKFRFLGGPKSQFEPLVDTTTSQFDSLFTVSDSDQSLSIEEEVSSFDIGSLDQALDEATQGVGVDTSLSDTVIQGSDLATQTVDVSFREENGRPPPTPSQKSDPIPVARDTIPFPPALLAIPDFEVASIQADTVKSGTLTGEIFYNGKEVNRIAFTLYNDPTNPTTLTDGSGNAPSIKIRDKNGVTIAQASFDQPIKADQSERVKVSVEGETLGEDSELVLVIDGNDLKDDLTVELFPLRYQEATLGGIDKAEVTATRTDISTRGGSGSQFAGIEVRSGTLQLDVTNNFSFPIQVDSLLLENHLQNSALPDTFPDLDVLKSSGSISPGATKTFTVDLGGKGIASGIDVRVKGGLADSRTTLTTAATDNVEISANGPLTVGTLYFWPDGEQLQAGGQFDMKQDRIRFDQSGDFVELKEGTLALDNIVSEPSVAFKSFTLSFPDIRRSPYNPGDSLAVEFSIGVSGSPSVGDVDLSGMRLFPTGNVVDYHLQGTLETIAPSNQTADNLRVVRFADEVRADVSVGQLEVRALRGSVNPFSVNVTEDANGDGRLNLANTAEATQESFGGFGGIAESVNGLHLTGSQVKFQVTTDAGTDARLYAALQGRQGGTRTFLGGKGEKSVPASAPLGGDFYAGDTQIARDNLIRFGIEGAPTDDPVTRSITLTGDNSTVNSFISTLPSSLRFVAQARLTGNDKNRIRLRRPLEFKAGLSVAVPVRVKGAFTLRDTIDADFSALNDVTDPSKDITISSAEFRVQYANGIPLGAEATLEVLDKNDNKILTLPGGGKTLRLEPAPKARDGTASGTRTGKTVLDLSKNQLRSLAQGRSVRLRLTMDQAEEGGPATIRASDTIELSLRAEVKASVKVK